MVKGRVFLGKQAVKKWKEKKKSFKPLFPLRHIPFWDKTMNVAREVLAKLPSKPSVFRTGGRNLYEVLSVLPNYGVGSRVVRFLLGNSFFLANIV